MMIHLHCLDRDKYKRDRFPKTNNLCHSEDHVGVRVGMFEMRGMGEYRGQIKYLQLMGTSEVSNGMGNTMDNATPDLPSVYCVHCWLRLLQPLH